MIVGQKSLLEKLNNYNIDTFPRSIMILGEKGMGKHTIAEYIAESVVKLPILDISNSIDDEYIDAIYRNPNPSIYLLDLSERTEKEQNILLKFVEEPLNNSFIIILAENKNVVLNTLINRCIVFELEAYTRDELSTFITSEADKELILDILRSPGKILATNINNIREMFDVCDKIATKMSAANYSNTLTIANKINFSDQYDKFDIDVFFDILCYSLFSHYLKTDNVIILNMYKITGEYRKKLLDKRLNKELFMENFLTKLWKVSRGV